MNKIDKFKMAAKSALVSAVVVPAMGVLAHFMGSGAFQHNDSSLSHQFECAYSINPNPKHKTFTSYQYVHRDVLDAWYDDNGNPVNDEGMSVPTAWEELDPMHPDYVKFCNKEKYYANPFLTAAMYAGVAGLAYVGLRRRKKNMPVLPTQKTR